MKDLKVVTLVSGKILVGEVADNGHEIVITRPEEAFIQPAQTEDGRINMQVAYVPYDILTSGETVTISQQHVLHVGDFQQAQPEATEEPELA